MNIDQDIKRNCEKCRSKRKRRFHGKTILHEDKTAYGCWFDYKTAYRIVDGKVKWVEHSTTEEPKREGVVTPRRNKSLTELMGGAF